MDKKKRNERDKEEAYYLVITRQNMEFVSGMRTSNKAASHGVGGHDKQKEYESRKKNVDWELVRREKWVEGDIIAKKRLEVKMCGFESLYQL
jgi:hypothetical protein